MTLNSRMSISLSFLMTKIIRFNITVLCTYKYCAALLLQILRCSAPTNIAQLCCYKYYGALHLQILRSSAATNITVLCTYKYYASLLLQILWCSAPTNITQLCCCKSLLIYALQGSQAMKLLGAEHRNICRLIDHNHFM